MTENIQVLLVEDESVLAAIVKESLEKRGFHISIANNGVEGWGMFKAMKPDVCVIDVMMPRKDGFSLVADIRLVDDEVPLIFLTARTQTEDVLKGLELGADDYLKKPFSMEELILRLKALVRRRVEKVPVLVAKEFLIGEFLFYPQQQELHYKSKIFGLSQREADLLLLLLQNKNQLLDRRIALTKLWGEDTPFTARSMDVYITRLRKFFKESSVVDIVNSRGQGYSLVEKH
ncbi:response regulator transcription factor [Mucilaginibacter agri]|uniref:Response regulator n=1 Tax=Mucilaginibacter agri TaxID=2695265 RepID=A0A965ZM05_9SPHI|nr:response regulator transcription factor [Mucilaginibacter agri]NCD72433.1 response regulator [Mucilaginibacter agri]